MKYKKPDHTQSGVISLEPVRFEFTHPTARIVGVAGAFNDWRSETKSMLPLGNGRWRKKMVLPPGTYEYCLVVDGKCMPDPLAKESVADPFGGVNSVLKVGQGAQRRPSGVDGSAGTARRNLMPKSSDTHRSSCKGRVTPHSKRPAHRLV